ncbi:phage portal protein [Spirosoma validum]|uniref:Phage portal protein n=1 Tax=Spirosoma validum TaxID=2771355 RepID=A0A927GDL6_9BACT|nr:phage portal protein [Spirosoma validum]MBD2753803.1 phage portal protein [Spirosoma validum]
MKYTDITGTEEDLEKVIKKLKGVKSDLDIATFKKQYDVSPTREILDTSLRPDKPILNERNETQGVERPNRLAFPLQKRIVGSTVAFSFGKPVLLNCEPKDETDKAILEAVKQIMDDNKIDSHNRKVARNVAKCTEVAEVWFPVNTNEVHDDYGFDTSFKLRVQVFSPWDGNKLYPYYDQTGDMKAFSREFTQLEDGNEITFFETYTDEEKIVWKRVQGVWGEFHKEPIAIGKIPVIYGHQEQVEWHDVQSLIKRLEELMSNFADTNDYNGSPILVLTGQILSMAKKGESGKMVQLDQGAKAEYASWDHAPESIKLEIETLVRFVYSLSQTPDLSFDSVKGLDISGIAMKFLFSDAHLKVEEKREIFDAYLQRRINVVKAYVAMMAKKWEKEVRKLKIKPEIVPFLITNEKDLIDLLAEASGGKALISQETAVEQSGLVKDAKGEYQKIKNEQKETADLNKLESTF